MEKVRNISGIPPQYGITAIEKNGNIITRKEEIAKELSYQKTNIIPQIDLRSTCRILWSNKVLFSAVMEKQHFKA